jgi:hypothetical protein
MNIVVEGFLINPITIKYSVDMKYFRGRLFVDLSSKQNHDYGVENPASSSLIVWTLSSTNRNKSKEENDEDGILSVSIEQQELTWIQVNPDDHNCGSQENYIMDSARYTWNWCRHFVQELELCPWAKSSLETKNAIQFFIVTSLPKKQQAINNQQEEDFARLVVENVAKKFIDEIISCDDEDSTVMSSPSSPPSILERAAIYMILFLSSNSSNNNSNSSKDISDDKVNDSTLMISFTDDFDEFYDWFVELEEEWGVDDHELEKVIVAPFHPDWEFGVDDNDDDDADERSMTNTALSYEKKSPFPLVSLVSARVVEQAAEGVTEKIGIHNEQVLTDHMSDVNGLETLWRSAVFTNETYKDR